VIILATTFTGVTDEHAIGKAFTEALPPGKGGGEDDHRQANQADLSQVKSEGDDQPNANEALPFTALLTVFFAVVAVIIDQQLFTPVIEFVLQIACSSVTPVKVVARMITDRPIRPTSAR
jgi:NhaB family Na+:H+ antiporter